jgi:hypothetical protein
VVRHQGVTLEVAPAAAAPTDADPLAVRLAAVWALELAAATAAAEPAAGDRSGRVGCKLVGGAAPTLVLEPAPGGGPGAGAADDAVPALLAAHGIRAAADGVALRVTFPAA